MSWCPCDTFHVQIFSLYHQCILLMSIQARFIWYAMKSSDGKVKRSADSFERKETDPLMPRETVNEDNLKRPHYELVLVGDGTAGESSSPTSEMNEQHPQSLWNKFRSFMENCCTFVIVLVVLIFLIWIGIKLIR